MEKQIVTRYAPSPTGYMHIGNLRTALYSFLVARHFDGKFILRIEDTDRARYVEGAEEVILETMRATKLTYDEGPDIGGAHGPYRQSERTEIYKKYAEKLIAEGKAYYCFCSKEELAENAETNAGYNGHCRNLSADEVAKNLAANKPYVIRFKMNHEGTTSYYDNIFGEITISNDTLQDIILIKSDGFPTYNFAHIIDDYLMGVTHVVRGNEYITSTPQYVQIHEALGWPLPEYYHLPLIMGKNADGEVSKLSKRHGAVSFADLTALGYLPEAIINYIALLGWHPSNDEQEIFSLEELISVFNPNDIRKSAAIFDYDKLKWVNAKYISKLTLGEFYEIAKPYIESVLTREIADMDCLLSLLQPRIQILSEIPEKIEFFQSLPEFDINLLANDKKKTTLDTARAILEAAINALNSVDDWTNDTLFAVLNNVAESLGFKSMSVMWVVRLAVSGNTVTVGGATEIMQVLGKDDSISRLATTLERLN